MSQRMVTCTTKYSVLITQGHGVRASQCIGVCTGCWHLERSLSVNNKLAVVQQPNYSSCLEQRKEVCSPILTGTNNGYIGARLFTVHPHRKYTARAAMVVQ